MKETQTVTLKLMILVVIGTFATALNLSIADQETIGLSWWGLGRAPHPWLGWPTHALEATAMPVVALWVGCRVVARGESPSPSLINALIIFSAVSSISGLVVYSLMAPITDVRVANDLRSRSFQLLFALMPELQAQLTAYMGVGAIARRLFAIDDARLKQ